MRHWTKVMALLLVFAMVITVAGCAGKTEQNGKGNGLQATEWDGKLPISAEKQTLRIFTHSGAGASFPPPSDDLPFWKALEEKTNVHIEWELSSYNEYQSIVSTKLAAGIDLPDIMNVSKAENSYSAGKNGILIPIEDYIDKYAYYTNKWFADGNQDVKTSWKRPDGHTYSFSGTVAPTTGQPALMYNKAWLEKLGASVPETVDDFTALAQKMKGVDFNGNGKQDEIVFTTVQMSDLNNMGTAFGVNTVYGSDPLSVDKDGKVSSDWLSPRYKEFLQYLNKLYSEGILDKEVFSNTTANLYENVAADRVGIVIYWSTFAQTLGNMTSQGQKAPDTEIYKIGPPLKGPHGDQYMVKRASLGSEPTGVTRECKNPELAVKWLDVLFANPDVLTTRIYGFEGQTYKVGADGKKELIMPTDGSSWSISELGCTQIPLPFIQSKDTLMVNRQHVKWFVDAQDSLQKYFVDSFPKLVMSDEEQEVMDTYGADIKTYIAESRAQFITGQKNFDGDWDQFLQALNSLHIEDFTKAYQSLYDRAKGNK